MQESALNVWRFNIGTLHPFLTILLQYYYKFWLDEDWFSDVGGPI